VLIYDSFQNKPQNYKKFGTYYKILLVLTVDCIGAGMEIYSKVDDIETIIHQQIKNKRSIGFVPTLGALHAGHISLITRARQENDIVVCSIFVNPTQFNDPSDYERYPQNVEKDSKMLADAGCNILFLPSQSEIYPNDSYKHITFDIGFLDTIMEGGNRPGHFKGVAAVVKRLFDIITPTRAYFGQKDYQQQLVIKKLVTDLKLPVKIVTCPTIREKNGLAMSSRNELLTPQQRQEASLIFKLLSEAKDKILSGDTDYESIKGSAMLAFATNANFKPEYFDICAAESLKPVHQPTSENLVICVAAKLGNVRLIDNVLVNE